MNCHCPLARNSRRHSIQRCATGPIMAMAPGAHLPSQRVAEERVVCRDAAWALDELNKVIRAAQQHPSVAQELLNIRFRPAL